jgi:hypothetical protein
VALVHILSPSSVAKIHRFGLLIMSQKSWIIWPHFFNLLIYDCNNSLVLSSICNILSSLDLVYWWHFPLSFFILFIEFFISKISIFLSESLSLLNFSLKSWIYFFIYLSNCILFEVIDSILNFEFFFWHFTFPNVSHHSQM